MTINLISSLNINDIYFFTADSAEMSADASAEKSAELPSPDDKPKEEEDTDGTKKMKKDFDLMFSGLDAEMEAGRSKLAKLRERIRKAKATIKDADDALAADDKAREEAKKKK